ncbi:hypothetical protein PM082_018974 [Marasmius tenuissimus]|nr:hypothetical protein PM082_018974 [Marasmius tenuissimus]
MANDIPLNVMGLTALWTETVLYGLYTTLFFICIYTLFNSSKLNKTLLASAVAMHLLCTTHVAIDFHRAIVAFTGSQGAVVYYAQFWDPTNTARQAIYVTNNFIADSLVVYRLYVVWGHRWKIAAIPVFMLVATSVCGYVGVWQYTRIQPGSNAYVKDIIVWGQALFGMSLGTNVIGTVLVASRIWWLGRQMQNRGLVESDNERYKRAVSMMIESGSLYSVSFIIFLILYGLNMQSASYITFDALVQITGIAPTLIIVRVALGSTTKFRESKFFGQGSRGTIIPLRVQQPPKSDLVHAETQSQHSPKFSEFDDTSTYRTPTLYSNPV